jgi:hypothetical protein
MRRAERERLLQLDLDDLAFGSSVICKRMGDLRLHLVIVSRNDLVSEGFSVRRGHF